MIAAVLFVVGLAAASAQNQNFNGGDAAWYCTILSSEDCTHQSHHPKCGTDGITYENLCALGKAHCTDNSVDQKHDGPCTSSESVGGTSTLSPEQLVQGSQIILDFQCLRLSHQACTHTIGEKICATDGVTYETFCEYEKARCTHRDLHVKKLGDCNAK